MVENLPVDISHRSYLFRVHSCSKELQQTITNFLLWGSGIQQTAPNLTNALGANRASKVSVKGRFAVLRDFRRFIKTSRQLHNFVTQITQLEDELRESREILATVLHCIKARPGSTKWINTGISTSGLLA